MQNIGEHSEAVTFIKDLMHSLTLELYKWNRKYNIVRPVVQYELLGSVGLFAALQFYQGILVKLSLNIVYVISDNVSEWLNGAKKKRLMV